MKKKFLIPAFGLGMALMAMSFVFTTTSSDENLGSVFVESDNIAFAHQTCGYKEKHYCVHDNVAEYDAEYCGGGDGPGGEGISSVSQ